jgi:hypothetical protein
LHHGGGHAEKVREIDRHEPADPAGTANFQSLHNRSAWFSRRLLIAADLNYSRDSGVF